jgi:hypothetical protein
MLRARRSAQVAAPRYVTLPIRPIGGQRDYDPSREIPAEVSPDMSNCLVRDGCLYRRPGFVQFKSGNSAIGTTVVGLYSTQDEENNTHLFAAHETGLAKFNTLTEVWDACTGPALTGSSILPMSFETSQNSVVFSQGADQVMRIPFSGTTYALLNADCPAARYLDRFGDRLVLGFTLESGISKPFRVRWPQNSDHTKWTGTGSGFRDASEWPYHLKGIRKLGTQLAVYYEHAIELASRTEMIPPFRFDVRAADIGLYAPATLQGRNDVHFFLGNDDFYAFDGVQVRSIGQPIRDSVFAELNASLLPIMFGEILLDTQEYLAFLCTGASSYPNKVWVYNWGRNVWYPWTVDGPRCSAIHRLDDTMTIDELVGTIDEQAWIFDSRIIQAAYPAFLTGNANGKIYQWSTAYTSDNGVAIPCKWTSKDFRSQDFGAPAGQEITIRRIAVHHRGTGSAAFLDVSFSPDGGSNWYGPYTVTLVNAVGGWHVSVLDHMFTGKQLRFKVEHSSTTSTFIISSFDVTFELRGMLEKE